MKAPQFQIIDFTRVSARSAVVICAQPGDGLRCEYEKCLQCVCVCACACTVHPLLHVNACGRLVVDCDNVLFVSNGHLAANQVISCA